MPNTPLTFDVHLVPSTGALIEIRSRWPKDAVPIATFPNAKDAAVRIHQGGREYWRRFGDGLPAQSLEQAISSNDWTRNAAGIMQIIAHHVEWTFMARGPEMVWSIEYRGGCGQAPVDTTPAPEVAPPKPWDGIIRLHHPGPYGGNHIRHIVIAATGQWFMSGTTPQPDPLPKRDPIAPSEANVKYRTPQSASPEPIRYALQNRGPRVINLLAVVCAVVAFPPFFDAPTLITLSSPQNATTVAPGSTMTWAITVAVPPSLSRGLSGFSVDLVQSVGNPIVFDIPPAVGVPASMTGFSRPTGLSNPGFGGVGTGYMGTPTGTQGSSNLAQIGGAQNTAGIVAPDFGHDTTVESGVGQVPGGLVVAKGVLFAPSIAGTYTLSLTDPRVSLITQIQTAPNITRTRSASTVLSGPLTFTITQPVCLADFNGDGSFTLHDLFDFLTAYFNNDPRANIDGVGGVSLQDIFAYLDVFFIGC